MTVFFNVNVCSLVFSYCFGRHMVQIGRQECRKSVLLCIYLSTNRAIDNKLNAVPRPLYYLTFLSRAQVEADL